MKQVLFTLASKALTSLLQRSIKNEDLLAFVLTLLLHLVNIVELLTDDDKDNSKQVKTYVSQNIDSLISSLTDFKESKI